MNILILFVFKDIPFFLHFDLCISTRKGILFCFNYFEFLIQSVFVNEIGMIIQQGTLAIKDRIILETFRHEFSPDHLWVFGVMTFLEDKFI